MDRARALPLVADPSPEVSAWHSTCFTGLRFLEHFIGRKLGKVDLVKRALDSLKRMNHDGMLRSLAGREAGTFHEAPECTAIEPKAFWDDYLMQARPLVMRGVAKDWECVRNWTPEFFGEKYGDDQIVLTNDHIAGAEQSVQERITLREIVRNLDSDMAKYARFVPILAYHPELFEDFDVDWIAKRIDRKGKAKLWGEKGRGTSLRSHLFLGRQGSKTEVHCALTNNLFVNVYGRKQWYLVSPAYNPMIYSPVNWGPGLFGTEWSPINPDERRFPLQRYIKGYKLTLEPGDILFNPPFWWHHVTNLTNTVSIGLRWYNFRGAMKASRTQNLLSLFGTNPSLYAAARNSVEYWKHLDARKRAREAAAPG